MLFEIISVAILVAGIAGEPLQNTKGPYDIKLNAIEECPEFPISKGSIKWEATLSDTDKNEKAVKASTTIPFAIDESVDVRLEVRKMIDGKWKPNFFTAFKTDVCQTAHKHFKKFTVKLLGDMGVPQPDNCPILAGTYSLDNYVPPLHLITIPFFYGQFMTEITILKNNETATCVCYKFDIVEIKQ